MTGGTGNAMFGHDFRSYLTSGKTFDFHLFRFRQQK